MRNLARPPGHPEADVSTTIDGSAVTIRCGLATSLTIAGLAVTDRDLPYALGAIAEMPSSSDRHDALADGMRLAAGRCAMHVADAMVRARMLDHVDGWGAVTGKIIDETEEGRLSAPAGGLGMTVRILTVICPSTGRQYALLVPEAMNTVQAARSWVNRGIPEMDVET